MRACGCFVWGLACLTALVVFAPLGLVMLAGGLVWAVFAATRDGETAAWRRINAGGSLLDELPELPGAPVGTRAHELVWVLLASFGVFGGGIAVLVLVGVVRRLVGG